MAFSKIDSIADLTEVVHVLNIAHGTVAEEVGFTKDTNPSNNAFIDASVLRMQLNKGVELYALSENSQIIGCFAIEKSTKEPDMFYIEKVSVIPEFRKQGYGHKLMEFAINLIREKGGNRISISLIDSNLALKNWYLSFGFIETSKKDFKHLPFKVCFMHKDL